MPGFTYEVIVANGPGVKTCVHCDRFRVFEYCAAPDSLVDQQRAAPQFWRQFAQVVDARDKPAFANEACVRPP